MKRELVYVENPTTNIALATWMTTSEVNKLRRRVENEHLPVRMHGGNGFTDTVATMSAAAVIRTLVPSHPHKKRKL